MIKRIGIVVCLVLGTVVLSAAKDPDKAAVRGTVVDKETGAPLAYATLSVVDSLYQITAVGTSQEDGSFHLEKIPYGRYNLVATFIGYKDYTLPVELVQRRYDAGIGAGRRCANNNGCYYGKSTAH